MGYGAGPGFDGGRDERMTPDEAIKDARAGNLRPVYLVVGEEVVLVQGVVKALRSAAMKDGIEGLNEDLFNAGDGDLRDSAESPIGAARMMPMMARRRLVLVRGLERWEGKDDKTHGAASEADKPKGKVRAPLDDLAEYAKEPADTCVLVLVATKLHGQRRLMTLAKKQGFLVACDAVSQRELPRFIEGRAKELGHAIDREAAGDLAAMVGPDLGTVFDALERLSLYVGPEGRITESAIADVITRVRPATSWNLVDAVFQRRMGAALALVAELEGDADLMVLGSIASSVRQAIKFDGLLQAGESVDAAASRANVQPWKVDALRSQLKRLQPGALNRWIDRIAEADRALKGSRRTGTSVLETLVVDLCS